MANITLVQMAIAIAMIKNLEANRDKMAAIEWLFIKSLAEWHAPVFSEKQFAWLRAIHDKVMGSEIELEIDPWALM